MRFTRERYQSGCLTREKRKAGPCVWIFRWRETRPEGRVNRKVVVGSVVEYPTKSAALKAVEALRVNINAECRAPLTVDQLTTHYIETELPNKAFSTNQVYRVYLKTWILPKWGHLQPSKLKTVAVEKWLRDLELANGSKAKIRNIMSALFNHAIRYQWLGHNPITRVRQSAKREGVPEVLDAQELSNLLSDLHPPYSTMVFLAATTGLRVSEMLALQWQDINFATGEINLRRAIVQQVIGEMKTEASEKPIPLGRRVGRGSWLLAGVVTLQSGQRLGLCQPYDAWRTAVLARKLTASLRPARCTACRHHEGRRLAFLPQNVCHHAQGWRGRREDRPGTDAARQQQDHVGRVCTGVDTGETVRTKEGD